MHQKERGETKTFDTKTSSFLDTCLEESSQEKQSLQEYMKITLSSLETANLKITSKQTKNGQNS